MKETFLNKSIYRRLLIGFAFGNLLSYFLFSIGKKGLLDSALGFLSSALGGEGSAPSRIRYFQFLAKGMLRPNMVFVGILLLLLLLAGNAAMAALHFYMDDKRSYQYSIGIAGIMTAIQVFTVPMVKSAGYGLKFGGILVILMPIVLLTVSILGYCKDSYSQSAGSYRMPDFRKNNRSTPVMPVASPKKPAVQSTGGKISIIKGGHVIKKIALRDGVPVILGRKEGSSNIIIDHPKVSRRHCSITYNRAKNAYVVEDFSSNGVFDAKGRKLPKGARVSVPAGSTLWIGCDQNKVKLG